MVKSRQKKSVFLLKDTAAHFISSLSSEHRLDERWGAETSAKGTRFKLNRDMAGYHLSNRAEITIEQAEPRVKIGLPDPEKLRTTGDLVHFDKVEYRFPKAKTPFLAEVTFTIEQGGRISSIPWFKMRGLLQVVDVHSWVL